MSRNRMPGLGKSGTVRTSALMSSGVIAGFLSAPSHAKRPSDQLAGGADRLAVVGRDQCFLSAQTLR